MAKSAYIGASNLAHKIKKMYVGDADGIARKVKKAYIGDANGKARLCFSGEAFSTVVIPYSSSDAQTYYESVEKTPTSSSWVAKTLPARIQGAGGYAMLWDGKRNRYYYCCYGSSVVYVYTRPLDSDTWTYRTSFASSGFGYNQASVDPSTGNLMVVYRNTSPSRWYMGMLNGDTGAFQTQDTSYSSFESNPYALKNVNGRYTTIAQTSSGANSYSVFYTTSFGSAITRSGVSGTAPSTTSSSCNAGIKSAIFYNNGNYTLYQRMINSSSYKYYMRYARSSSLSFNFGSSYTETKDYDWYSVTLPNVNDTDALFIQRYSGGQKFTSVGTWSYSSKLSASYSSEAEQICVSDGENLYAVRNYSSGIRIMSNSYIWTNIATSFTVGTMARAFAN